MKRPVRATLAAALAVLLCAGIGHAAGIHMQFVTTSPTVNPGDTLLVDVRVSPADAEFNAFDLFIQYDPAALTFLPTSPVGNQRGPLMTAACSNDFHLFTPTAGMLSVNYSLLCNQVFVTGPGVIYRVRFIAGTTLGPTSIACGAGTEFYRAGFFVRPVDCTALSLTVGGISGVGDPQTTPAAPVLDSPQPNPWPGVSPAVFPFTLPAAGPAVLEIYDAAGRRVAAGPRHLLDAGPHRLTWNPGPLPAGRYFVRLSTAAGRAARATWTVVR